MKLDDNNIKKFGPRKYFAEYSDKINSISFSSNGDHLLTSSYDEQMIIYDCSTGSPIRNLNSKKYGVNLIQFTHVPGHAIYASTKVDDTIRYLNLHDNKYIRYFPGHTKRVISLAMCPTGDLFVSGSLDRTVRLWDIKAPQSPAPINTQGRPIASFDPDGVVIAAGINGTSEHSVKLYDIRNADKGHFASFEVNEDAEDEWNSVKFSPNGRLIGISSNGSTIKLIDSFDGKLIANFQIVNGNPQRHPIDFCFSPDSNYLVCGTTEGQLCIWNIEHKGRVAVLSGHEQSQQQPGIINQPINCIGFNPKFAMIATGVTHLTLWAPALDE